MLRGPRARDESLLTDLAGIEKISMNILQDLRFALRSLRSHAGTAGFAVLTLAAGMAAAIAISCAIDAVFLRALAYPRADELVQISERAGFSTAFPPAIRSRLSASACCRSARCCWPACCQHEAPARRRRGKH
jgi:hypothetical protein